MNYKKILWFIGLVIGFYGLISIVVSLVNMEEMGIGGEIAKLLAYFWTPAIAAAIVQMGIYKQPMYTIGLIRKYMDRRWYWFGLSLPYLALGGTIFIVYVLGNLFHIPGFGEIVYTDSSLNLIDGFFFGYVYPLSEYIHIAEMPPEVLFNFFYLLIMGIIIGPSFYLIVTLGEEIGWRGLMTVETQKLGYWESNLMVGGLWALSYLPLVMMSSGGTNIPIAEIGILIGFCVSLSYVMSYINFKSNSILASAAFRGVLVFTTAAFDFWVIGGDELVGSMFGVAGILFFMTVALLISRFDRNFVENYTTLTFTKPSKKASQEAEGNKE